MASELLLLFAILLFSPLQVTTTNEPRLGEGWCIPNVPAVISEDAQATPRTSSGNSEASSGMTFETAQATPRTSSVNSAESLNGNSGTTEASPRTSSGSSAGSLNGNSGTTGASPRTSSVNSDQSLNGNSGNEEPSQSSSKTHADDCGVPFTEGDEEKYPWAVGVVQFDIVERKRVGSYLGTLVPDSNVETGTRRVVIGGFKTHTKHPPVFCVYFYDGHIAEAWLGSATDRITFLELHAPVPYQPACIPSGKNHVRVMPNGMTLVKESNPPTPPTATTSTTTTSATTPFVYSMDENIQYNFANERYFTMKVACVSRSKKGGLCKVEKSLDPKSSGTEPTFRVAQRQFDCIPGAGYFYRDITPEDHKVRHYLTGVLYRESRKSRSKKANPAITNVCKYEEVRHHEKKLMNFFWF